MKTASLSGVGGEGDSFRSAYKSIGRDAGIRLLSFLPSCYAPLSTVVMHKKIIIREIIIILAITFCYWLLLSEALNILMIDAPSWFTSLFKTKLQALILWTKAIHTVAVGLVAVPIGLLTVKALKQKAKIGGLIVGSLLAVWTAAYDYVFLIRYEVVHDFAGYLYLRLHEPGIPVWLLPSDLIVIAIAVPLAAFTIQKIKNMHNNGVKTHWR